MSSLAVTDVTGVVTGPLYLLNTEGALTLTREEETCDVINDKLKMEVDEAMMTCHDFYSRSESRHH